MQGLFLTRTQAWPSRRIAPSATDSSICFAYCDTPPFYDISRVRAAFGRLIGLCDCAPAPHPPQGYMVLEDGDFVTPIEGWFFMPSLSKYAEKGGVSERRDTTVSRT